MIFGSVFVFVSACGTVLSYQFMQLLHTTPETIELASNYIRIIFIGFPFLAVYNIYDADCKS